MHANPSHLAWNMLGIAIFGTAVCHMMGTGAGWLMILVTGMLGNVVNALLYESHHLSIGASTAIFGAIGLLAGHQFMKKRSQANVHIKAWLPIGGGLALLAFLGSSAHSDLTAHLFGFLVGLIMGGLYSMLVPRPAGKPYQMGLLVIASSVMALSWMRGYHAF